MDSKQIDVAMRNKTPAMYNKKRYERILEYVMWYNDKGERKLSAVLLADGCSIRVPAEKVEECVVE